MRSSTLRAGAALLVLSILALILVAGPAAAAGSSTPSADLSLLSQTTWVNPGQSFSLQFALSGSAAADPGSLQLEVSVYQALLTRTAFDLSQTGRDLGRLLWTQTSTLAQLAPAVGGFDLCIPVDVEPSRTCPANAPLLTGSRPGVYPVQLTVLDTASGTSVGHLYTHLVIVPAEPASDPLSVALIVPVAAPSPLSPSARRRLGSGSVTRLGQLASNLADHGAVALTLASDPSTLSALADTPGPGAKSALAGLKRLAPGAQMLALPFAPTSAQALVDSGLGSELTAQLSRGGDVDQNELGLRPSPATWLVSGSLDHSTDQALAGLGVTHLIVPSADLQSAYSALTPAEPFPLQFGSQTVPSLVEDSGLGNDLSLADPVLAVHEMLADLAQIYYESPNLTDYVNGVPTPEARGVVALAPRYWSLSRAADDALLDGLAYSPIVRSSSVADLFASLTISPRDRDPANPTGRHAALDAGQVRTLRQQLTSLSDSMTQPLPQALVIGDLILTSETTGLSPAARSAYLDSARDRLDRELQQVSVAASSLTLTSRQANVPISIVSNLPGPIRVRVQLSSTRLAFRDSGGGDSVEKNFTLRLRNTTWLVPVTARTTGSFDVIARVEAANGGTLLDTSKVAITSKAFSGVGIVLSVAALAVLAFWWGRALQKGRRNKRLVERGGP